VSFFPMPSLKLASKKRAPTASWLDIVWKAVHQLSVIHTGRDHFHYYQDICRYIETHWERLAQGKDRTSTWTNTVSSTITTHKRIFKPGPDQGFWGLRQHPDDDTPQEILDEIRSELQKEQVPVPFEVSPQQSRRKRKTGWGDSKNKKRQRVKKSVNGRESPQEDWLDQSDSEDESEFDDVEFSDSLTDENSGEPKTVSMAQLPPIFSTLVKEQEEEEEFVDIEGVSEEEAYSSPEELSSHLTAPSSPEKEFPVTWSASLDESSHDCPPSLFVAEGLPGEDWFQSLFQQ